MRHWNKRSFSPRAREERQLSRPPERRKPDLVVIVARQNCAVELVGRSVVRKNILITRCELGAGRRALGAGYFHANKQTAETNFIAALAQCEAAVEIFRKQNDDHLVTVRR